MVTTAPEAAAPAAPVPNPAPATEQAPSRFVSTFGQPRGQALRLLLEAGVHFGHQAKRWNPKMKSYIFTERNGIHIIDPQQTVYRLEEAQKFASDVTARGGKILFVGTKKQASEIIEREAERSGQYYISRRWMGGTLTNFITIRSRLRVLKQLQDQSRRGEFEYLPKQEAASKEHDLEKLNRSLGGMSDMTQLPGAVFIVDTKREHLAVHEARRLNIPIIALTDTNSDPDDADYVIPSNDDAIRALRLLTASIADAAIDGQRRFESTGGQAPQAEGRSRRGGDAPITAETFASAPSQAAPRSRRPANAAASGLAQAATPAGQQREPNAPAEQGAPVEVTAPTEAAATVPAANATADATPDGTPGESTNES